MKKIKYFLSLGLGIFVLLTPCQPKVDIEKEKAAVKAVIQNVTDAYLAKDIDKVSTFYVQDEFNTRLQQTCSKEHPIYSGWSNVKSFLESEMKDSSSIVSQVTITILYDNVSYDTMFTPSNGFSCFITGLEKTILFDTGGEPDILLHNMKQANINPDRIQYLVFSHIHRDHIGGLMGETVWKNMETVFLPVKLDSLGDGIERGDSLPVGLFPHVILKRVDSLPVGLFPHVFLTGVMPPVPANVIHGDEQSLIIDTPQGLVLITGCAHPGIVSLLNRAKEIAKKDIYLVLGGFHLLNQTDEQIKTIVDSLKSMGVRYVGPAHCTGDKAKAAFREAYGDHYVEMGVGRTITLDKDGLLFFSH
jgi:7,8-dihydropterin-6-yl-methyl-4-(beta-D-ribofuranosyl)aminobenzene 5'-phosphate synthase